MIKLELSIEDLLEISSVLTVWASHVKDVDPSDAAHALCISEKCDWFIRNGEVV